MTRGVSLEAGAVDHGEICGEAVQRLAFGAAQQVPDEQAVPGQLGDHAHVDRQFGIGASHEVLHVVGAALHVFQHVGMERVEPFGRHGGVVFPPDAVLDGCGAHHVLVLGRAAGELAGGHQEGAAIAQRAFTVLERRFDQRWLHKIVKDIAQPADPLIFKPELRVYPSKCHIAKLL